MLKSFLRELDRILTAMSCAEAGDLDAVKAILDRRETPAGRRVNRGTAMPGGADQNIGGAKILQFRRTKPEAAAEAA